MAGRGPAFPKQPTDTKGRQCGKTKILGSPIRRRRRRNTCRLAGRNHARLRRRDHALPTRNPRGPLPALADMGRRADIQSRQSRLRRNVRRLARPRRRACHCGRISMPRHFMRGKRRGDMRRAQRTLDGVRAYHLRDSTPFRFRGKFPISYFKRAGTSTRRHGRATV